MATQYNTYSSEFEKKIVARVIEIMERHTQEMEGYSYFGSNPGIAEDSYEDIACEIMKEIAE